MRPIQWAVGSRNSGSRLVNLYAEALPADGKSPVKLLGAPGTALFNTLPTYPVLAVMAMDNVLYAATPTKLYRIARNGAYTELGDVSLNGRVSWATNGFQLVLVDGARGYAYDKDLGSVYQLSGDGWYPANTVTYQDGYFAFNRAGTGEWFLSKLLSTDFDAQDYINAEGAPDDTVAVISDHREIWALGERTGEVYWNSGDADFPFERSQGAFIERGCIAPHSLAKMDNSVFWLADDRTVRRASGYQPVRISDHDMERAIKRGTVSDAYAYSYSDEGHTFYVLTFPTLKQTWAFDAATGQWHERSHYQWGRHHANCYVHCYDLHLVGDFQNGNIYQLDRAAYGDDGDPIVRVAVSPPISLNRMKTRMHRLELDIKTGVGTYTGQGEDPQVRLRYREKDADFGNERWRPLGKMGKYLTRVLWTRLGSFRERQIEIQISDPVPVEISGAFVEVERGRL